MPLPDPSALFDPRRLDALSRELAAAAADLAGRRGELLARAGELSWHSPAGRACTAVLHELLDQVGRSGNRLTDLAAAVRSHRHRATDRAAALAAMAHSGLAAVERIALDRIARLP